ncbi:hypothetical protein EJ110_NYTH05946 [Nymphaea thermarum]|nr:hypothetical protein EJ110_NYTH05946 [Nymphaea thermarum]
MVPVLLMPLAERPQVDHQLSYDQKKEEEGLESHAKYRNRCIAEMETRKPKVRSQVQCKHSLLLELTSVTQTSQNKQAIAPPKYIDREVKRTVVRDQAAGTPAGKEVLGDIDDDLTALELWSTLATTYSQVSEARFLQLRRQFQDIKRGTRTVLEYLNEITSVSDQLAAIGHPVNDKDNVQQALSGLGTDFDIFCTALEVLSILPSFEDLKAKFFQHEASRVQRQNLIPSNSHNVLITGTHALQGNCTRPWTSQVGVGRGILPTPPGMNTTSRRVPTRFYCNKRGHVKSECLQNPQNKNNQIRRENKEAARPASSSSGSNPTSNVSADVQQLLMTALSKLHLKQNEQGEWYVDSGAATHVTGDTALKTKWEELDYHVTDEWKCGSDHSLY